MKGTDEFLAQNYLTEGHQDKQWNKNKETLPTKCLQNHCKGSFRPALGISYLQEKIVFILASVLHLRFGIHLSLLKMLVYRPLYFCFVFNYQLVFFTKIHFSWGYTIMNNKFREPIKVYVVESKMVHWNLEKNLENF